MKNIKQHIKIAHTATIILCSLITLMQQSCGETIIPEEQEYAISMTASSADMSTSRALITDSTTLQATSLGVYAYKEVNSIKTLVFDNIKLTYDNTKGWDYSPTKYWDKAATEYRFLAYSPYSTSNIRYNINNTNNINNHTLTISDIPYWQEINDTVVDYLVANSSGSANHYLSTSKSVNFNFNHILSQLVINVVKDGNLKDTKYKVQKIEYINVPASGGKAEFTYSSSPSFSDITITSSSSNPSSVSMYTSIDGSIPPINLPHLVVPFTLTDSKNVQVKVTYTVEGTQRTKTVDTGITQLEAGKRYELTLTFKGADVSFGMVVKNWAEQPVDEDPKYNW